MNIDVNGVNITLTPEQIAEIEKQTSKNNKMEKAKERFLHLFNGCEVVLNEKYPNSIFYKKNGAVWFEQNFKNESFWCSYGNVWSIFESEFGLNYNEIKDLIKGVLEERLGLGSFTPIKRGYL